MWNGGFPAADTWERFLDGVDANREMWHALARRAEAPADLVSPVRAVGGRWHLLVLLEDWCGDAVNTVPWLAALAGPRFPGRTATARFFAGTRATAAGLPWKRS
jgi:hypothetical protein